LKALPIKADDLFYEDDLDLVVGRDGICLDLDGGGEGGGCSLLGVVKREESHLF
jgi:hypothetical protein